MSTVKLTLTVTPMARDTGRYVSTVRREEGPQSYSLQRIFEGLTEEKAYAKAAVWALDVAKGEFMDRRSMSDEGDAA